MADNNSTIIVDVKINTEEADKRAKDLVASIKNIQAEQAKLKKSGDQTSIAYTNNAQSLKNLQAEQKAYITISQNAAGSNNTLRAQLSLLTTQYNSLGREERNGTAEGKAYEAQIRSITDELKKNESAVGDNRRNVGNYADSLKKSHSTVTGFGEAIKQTGISFGFLPTSVARAGTAITNFVGAQRNVIQGFQTITQLQAEATAATEAAAIATEADALAQEQLAAGEITREAAEVVATTATIAQTTATEAQTIATEAATGATGLLKIALASTGIGLFILALGTLVTYFNSTNEGAKKVKVIIAEIGAVFQESLKTLGSYGKVIYDILSGNFAQFSTDLGKANDNLKGIVSNSIDAAKAAGLITVERQKLTKSERDYSTEKLKQQGIVELLTKKLRDANIPEQERTKLAQQAIGIRDQIFQKELGFAKQNESLVNKEQSLNSKKDLQAIADARNRVQEVINAHQNQVQTIENRESRLTATLDKEAKKRTAQEIKNLEEIARSKLASAAGILTAREQEFEKINLDIDKRVTLYRKYNNVVEQLEKERGAKLKELAEKYANEDTVIIQDALSKATDARIAMIQNSNDREDALRKQKNEKELSSIDKQILDVTAKIVKGEEDKNNVLGNLLNTKQTILDKQANEELDRIARTFLKEDDEQRKHLLTQNEAVNIEKSFADEKAKINDAVLSDYQNLFGGIADLFGKNSAAGKIAFAFQKGLAIAQIIINSELAKSAITLATATQVAEYSALGPFGIPFIAAAEGLGVAKTAEITLKEFFSVGLIAAQTVSAVVSGKALGGIQKPDFVSDGKGHVFPGYAKHDTINARLAEGEVVMTAGAARDPHTLNLLSAINVAYGGRDFSVPNTGRGYALGGTYSGSAQQSASNDIAGQIMVANSNMLNMLSNLKIYTAVTDINDGQNNYAKIVQSGNF